MVIKCSCGQRMVLPEDRIIGNLRCPSCGRVPSLPTTALAPKSNSDSGVPLAHVQRITVARKRDGSVNTALICGNCGNPIGKLERVENWCGTAVCVSCHQRLVLGEQPVETVPADFGSQPIGEPRQALMPLDWDTNIPLKLVHVLEVARHGQLPVRLHYLAGWKPDFVVKGEPFEGYISIAPGSSCSRRAGITKTPHGEAKGFLHESRLLRVELIEGNHCGRLLWERGLQTK